MTGTVQGVRGGDCGGIFGGSQYDTSWASDRGETELENLDHRGRVADGGLRRCPVEGCPGGEATRTAMRVHFMHWHVLDTIVIVEEGNPPHPRCPYVGRSLR